MHDRTIQLLTELESELINNHSLDAIMENNTPSILRMPLLAVALERQGLLIMINRSQWGPDYKQYGSEKSILGHVLQCERKVKRLWNSQVKMTMLLCKCDFFSAVSRRRLWRRLFIQSEIFTMCDFRYVHEN